MDMFVRSEQRPEPEGRNGAYGQTRTVRANPVILKEKSLPFVVDDSKKAKVRLVRGVIA